MTDAELARWLREELPRLNVVSTYPREGRSMEIDGEVAGALTELMALLGEAAVCMTLAGNSKRKIVCRARLRAVLREL